MPTASESLEIFCSLNKLNLDIKTKFRDHGADETDPVTDTFVRIAKELNFRVKVLPSLNKKFPVPAVFIDKEGHYGVIFKADFSNGKCIALFNGEKSPKQIDIEEFEKTISSIIYLAHRDIPDMLNFGISWFYKELFRYKRVLVEVFAGSFIVNLFVLATPLFTQVILDKVLVHNSITTLNVLMLGFSIIIIFEYLLNITRNYIFLHTANKIDAKLSSQLFKKLMSLRYAYFENNKVGNIIAKVRELEVIREFIANKTVSVVIDKWRRWESN
jgi:subfamily B ATP-binding cassette protein HlyB/CyaB